MRHSLVRNRCEPRSAGWWRGCGCEKRRPAFATKTRIDVARKERPAVWCWWTGCGEVGRAQGRSMLAVGGARRCVGGMLRRLTWWGAVANAGGQPRVEERRRQRVAKRRCPVPRRRQAQLSGHRELDSRQTLLLRGER